MQLTCSRVPFGKGQEISHRSSLVYLTPFFLKFDTQCLAVFQVHTVCTLLSVRMCVHVYQTFSSCKENLTMSVVGMMKLFSLLFSKEHVEDGGERRDKFGSL